MIIIGNSQQMSELADASIHLTVTSPPYPMIQMWDEQFSKVDPKIAELWKMLEADDHEETVAQIYDAMHESLAKAWQETYRVLVNGGIACINIGDATRTINGKFRLSGQSSSSGGPWLGGRGSQSPRWRRMRSITGGSSITERKRISPPQWGQTSGSAS